MTATEHEGRNSVTSVSSDLRGSSSLDEVKTS